MSIITPYMAHVNHHLWTDRQGIRRNGGADHRRTIQRRDWFATAQRSGIGNEGETIVNELIARTPGVIATVQAQLPANFPEAVAHPIFAGLAKAAKMLAV